MKLEKLENLKKLEPIVMHIHTSVRYNENESILNRKKSVAYRHSGLRPGIQYKHNIIYKMVSPGFRVKARNDGMPQTSYGLELYHLFLE